MVHAELQPVRTKELLEKAQHDSTDNIVPESGYELQNDTAAVGHSSLTDNALALWYKVLQRRAPEVVTHLQAEESVDLPTGRQAIPYLQALNIRYQLLRIVDENEAIRDRRTAETRGGESAVLDSFSRLVSLQNNVDVVASLAARSTVGPTITAHPTETKRVTVLEIHRRIYRGLVALETDRWTPRERQNLIDDIEAEIDLLWLTGELRLDRPSPEDEIGWGLHFFSDALFEAVPQVCQSLDHALNVNGELDKETIPQLQFHSWVGGDRDGNPHVTTEVTRHALDSGRKIIFERYDHMLRQAASRLSVSNLIAPLEDELFDALKPIIGSGQAALRNINETFRRSLSGVRSRLQENGYHHVSDFIADIQTIERCLRSLDCSLLADRYIKPIRWSAEIFGFRTVTVDIRQNSTVCNATLKEVWDSSGLDPAPDSNSAQWSERLRAELAAESLGVFDMRKLSPQSAEFLNLLILMHNNIDGPDPKAIGPFILSMTQSADDLAAVLLLARYVGFDREAPELRVVPLFETIDDLRRAPEIIRQFFEIPCARRSLTRPSSTATGKSVEIMLGYSDSNKDGGFICSNWEVHCAQSRIASALETLGLETSFFHGRGGSVSRGGAPTQRAIEAQPRGTIGDCIRLTEQGEVVSARYANRGSAAAHLELLLASTLSHRLRKHDLSTDPEYEDSMAALSGLSQTTYTTLVNAPGFLDYFQQASPVEELANLKIGSRPAKRFGANTLDDLRAIPWVFAWTQNRHLITGWYGFGSAVDNFISIRGESGFNTLKKMFEHSDFFRLVVDETEKTLFQTDLNIAMEYASLVTDPITKESITKMIIEEHQKSVAAVQLITENNTLAQRFPEFCHLFNRYARDLDKVHRLQIELLRQTRSPQHNEAVSIPLLQSMHCISSALGWTG